MRNVLSNLLNDTCDVGAENKRVLLDEEVVFSNLEQGTKSVNFWARERQKTRAAHLPVYRLNRYGVNLRGRRKQESISIRGGVKAGIENRTTHFDDDFALLSCWCLCRIHFELLFGSFDPRGRVANHCRVLREDEG